MSRGSPDKEWWLAARPECKREIALIERLNGESVENWEGTAPLQEAAALVAIHKFLNGRFKSAGLLKVVSGSD